MILARKSTTILLYSKQSLLKINHKVHKEWKAQSTQRFLMKQFFVIFVQTFVTFVVNRFLFFSALFQLN